MSEHVWCDDYLVRSLYLKNTQTNETRQIQYTIGLNKKYIIYSVGYFPPRIQVIKIGLGL